MLPMLRFVLKQRQITAFLQRDLKLLPEMKSRVSKLVSGFMGFKDMKYSGIKFSCRLQ